MNITREYYLDMIRPYYEVDLIKVITGVRRSGKSVLLASIRDELIGRGISGDNIIYINLEDFEYDFIRTASDLHNEIKKRCSHKGRCYIFLDEIQHVKHFEKALASFRATMNVSIFVTGSNSTLLSGELATLLTGRTVEFEVFPFSFAEMKSYFEINNRPYSDDLIYSYIKWGGFPLRFDFNREEDILRYLNALFDSIIGKDIARKSSHIDKKTFRSIALFILANAGKVFSADNILNGLHAQMKCAISKQTLYGYLDKMQKAYLIHSVQKYDISGKRALKSHEKFYAVDMGLRVINTNTVDFEDTFFLENVIFNELILRGYTVFVGKTYKSEVDFIAVKGSKKCFIQVAYLLASEQTIEREFGAFRPISDASPKYVMSLDKIDMSRSGIVHLNIVDFLLHRVDIVLT